MLSAKRRKKTKKEKKKMFFFAELPFAPMFKLNNVNIILLVLAFDMTMLYALWLCDCDT